MIPESGKTFAPQHFLLPFGKPAACGLGVGRSRKTGMERKQAMQRNTTQDASNGCTNRYSAASPSFASLPGGATGTAAPFASKAVSGVQHDIDFSAAAKHEEAFAIDVADLHRRRRQRAQLLAHAVDQRVDAV